MMDFEDFVKKATAKHGSKYRYYLSEWYGAIKKTKITCVKHGDFYQVARVHLRAETPCKICLKAVVSPKLRKRNLRETLTKEVIERDYLLGEMTIRDLARMHGANRDTVVTIMKEYGISPLSGGRRAITLVGQRFGSLLAIGIDKSDLRRPKHICRCDCGQQSLRSASDLLNEKHKSCWDCRNKFISERKWKGCGEISGDMWSAIKRSASVRGLDFDISIEEAWDLCLKQGKKCALSGVDLMFSRTKRTCDNSNASLDRIDSSKGYTKDNIQWVHKVINNLKMDLNEQDFLIWCRLVTERHS